MKFDFLGLRGAIQSMGESVRELRQKIEALKREREDLVAAPYSREDVAAILMARIDRDGQKYANRLRASLVPAIKRGEDLHQDAYLPMLTAEAPNVAASARTIESAFCLLFAEQMKRAVAGFIESMDWPEGAVSHADRTARLEKLDAEIGRLEAEEMELANQARAAGVILS